MMIKPIIYSNKSLLLVLFNKYIKLSYTVDSIGMHQARILVFKINNFFFFFNYNLPPNIKRSSFACWKNKYLIFIMLIYFFDIEKCTFKRRSLIWSYFFRRVLLLQIIIFIIYFLNRMWSTFKIIFIVLIHLIRVQRFLQIK